MAIKALDKQVADQATNLLLNQTGTPKTVQAAEKATGSETATQKALGGITQSYYTTPSTATSYQNNRPTYAQSQAVTDAWNAVNQQQANAPAAYQSQYGDQIQSLLNQMLNRPSFSYDFATDPMYQQYKETYQQQGKQASKDAMGQATALSGGYGNSYAQSVGQQTNQQYLSKLNDVIPELREAAYQKYQDEGTTLNNNIGTLQNQESALYQKYRDNVSDYNTELNFLYNAASDMSEQEYNHYQNDVSAWEADRAYWYQKAQDDYAKQLAAAASKSSGRGSGGGGGSGGKSASVPDNYKDFVALTGQSGIMTASEFTKRGGSGYGSYQDYLNAMWAKYM